MPAAKRNGHRLNGRTRAVLAALALLVPGGHAGATGVLPDAAPLPFERPRGTTGAAAMLDGMVTAGTAALSAAAGLAADPGADRDIARLKNGLDALAANDLDSARLARDNAVSGSLDRKILTWAIAASGMDGVTSGEVAAAARLLTDWPGIAALRDHSERAMYRENPGPRIVLDAFGRTRPQTAQGAILLARAHLAVGNADTARAVLGRMWRSQRLEAGDEQAVIAEFGNVIPVADHRFRMERMLYADRLASAERVAVLAQAPELAKAFAAVNRNDKGAARLLEAVPQAQRSAAFTFAEARRLRRAEKYKEAAAVMLTAPKDAAALVDPDAWWVERRVLSRELLDTDDPATAYRLAAAHAAETPSMAVDAEFHAGWYAFRGLGDASKGAGHFARIADIAEGPISLSRAHYWLGRAAEAGGPGDAKEHYERAAAHGTAFYGQLAAAKLGRTAIATDAPIATDEDRKAFAAREAVQAIERLERAGHPRRADALYRALAQQLESVGELTLLAAMAEQRSDHFLALRIGKWASARGLPVGALSHPTGAIPDDAAVSGAGKALAYAIARQESEFNISARSGAGALGLLQLMPATARDMAGKAGLDWSQGRLTSDAGYNATLGAAYLEDQLSRFSGSYVLTFAGYNAGPRRARDWVARYGDPRGKPVEEVVDWIERVPFTETRSYIQRVMENYQVYKMRLSGRVDIVADLVNGR